MARPTTKEDLLVAADLQYNKLIDLINSMNETQQNATIRFSADFLAKHKEAHWQRDENLRDVLIHLYEWHKLVLNWVSANQVGDNQPFLPVPYNWRNYAQMNFEFQKAHQSTTLEQAKQMLQESHLQMISLIDSFSNDQLFKKQVFNWTGSSTLGAYCVSSTSSHYEWALKKIKQMIKQG